MSEMIERVAKALWAGRFPDEEWTDLGKLNYMGHARAAIEAMREPTDEMITAADHVNAYWHHEVGEMVSEWRDEMRQEYQAMIDTALK